MIHRERVYIGACMIWYQLTYMYALDVFDINSNNNNNIPYNRVIRKYVHEYVCNMQV